MVYLITDIDQRQRMVTALIVSKYHIMYEVSSGTDTSEHYDFEISTDKNVLI